MNFKTKKGMYKAWMADRKNIYAYNVETKEELIVDSLKFDKWVRSGDITILESNESYIDEKRFKLPK